MNKKIKDLTDEQAKIIAKLAYGFEKWIKGELEVKYQPYDKSWYSDAREYVRITFNACLMADIYTEIYVEILPSLNTVIDYLDPITNRRKSMPLRNQYKIQKSFMEWGITPDE